MQLRYENVDDPTRWVSKTEWSKKVGRAPDSRTPALDKDSWGGKFPDDGYPDGRAPEVYCLPTADSDPAERLEERVGDLEQWRRETRNQLATLGQHLDAKGRQAERFGQALSAVAALLEGEGEGSQALADRLLAMSLDEPSSSAAPEGGSNE